MASYHAIIQPHKEMLFEYYQKYESEISSMVKSLPERLLQKSVSLSEKLRLEGNELFKRPNKDDETNKNIFLKYTQSIALAPKDSNHLALAFGNRSAFLLNTRKLEESIEDIDRALRITNSEALEIKLICRKVECLKRLGKYDDDKILNKALSLVTNFEKGSELREYYDKIIEKAKGKFEIYRNNAKPIKKTIPRDGVLHENKNKKVNDFSDIYLDYDKTFGKLLRAKKDFKTGEIVFIEKMYAAVPNTARRLQICNHCLLMTWSSIPCDYCPWALYCSENCKTIAWEKYHDFECPFICNEDCFSSLRESDMSLRTFIMGIKEAGNLFKLKTELEGGDKLKYVYYIIHNKIIFLKLFYCF